MTKAASAERKLSKRGQETEQRFLDAANDMFWANGFAGAKIGQIIAAGDLSVGSFYHMFGDKSDLLNRATERVLVDFHVMFDSIDLSRDANVDVFTMLYRLSYAGRVLIRRHRGIYRAMAELAQNDVSGFGPMQAIAPTVVERVQEAMPQYADQFSGGLIPEKTNHAVQLITMTALQTELGMGPYFPQDVDGFARVIARAGCGVLGYSGQTERPSVAVAVDQGL